MSVAIECECINKRYGEKETLKNISFKINMGECIALLGQNGAGKTTLLNIMLEKLYPTSGNVKNKYQVITVKVIKMTIESFICIVLIFLTGYFLKGIQLSLSQWVISGLVLLLGSVIFLSLGLLLTLFSSMQTASLFSNILYLGLAILGGLWFPLNQFPKWVQELGKCTPTYHFRELAVGYIDKGNIPIQSTIILCSYCLVFLLVYVFLSKKRDTSL